MNSHQTQWGIFFGSLNFFGGGRIYLLINPPQKLNVTAYEPLKTNTVSERWKPFSTKPGSTGLTATATLLNTVGFQLIGNWIHRLFSVFYIRSFFFCQGQSVNTWMLEEKSQQLLNIMPWSFVQAFNTHREWILLTYNDAAASYPAPQLGHNVSSTAVYHYLPVKLVKFPPASAVCYVTW